MRAFIRLIAVALIGLGVVAVTPHTVDAATAAGCGTLNAGGAGGTNINGTTLNNYAFNAGDVVVFTLSAGTISPSATDVHFTDAPFNNSYAVPASGSATTDYTIANTGLHTLQWAADAPSVDASFNLTVSCIPVSLSPCQGGDVPRGYKVINGTSGDDTLFSASGNNVFYGNGGNDHIYAGSGNDIICTGDGNDVISAGSGNDTIYSGDGYDQVAGGSGTDKLVDPECNTPRSSIESFTCF